MTLEEIRECLAADIAWETFWRGTWDNVPSTDCQAAYADERARQIAQVLVAEEHARAEAVLELVRQAEHAAKFWSDGLLGETAARVRALYPESK